MGFHSRTTYWSHSKLAKLIREVGGLPVTPAAGTSEEWAQYRRESTRINKFADWLSDEALNGIQDFINWPLDKAHDFTYWINNRFVEKNHMLGTGLKPGEYAGVDTRILHGLFNTLVVFVEEEKAWMEYICSNKEKNYDSVIPFYKRNWPFRHFTTLKSPELGLVYLNWEASLVRDDEWFGYDWREKKEPDVVSKERAENNKYGKPTPQAESAMEIIALYKWWTEVRPMRKDPHDESGWSALCDKRRDAAKDKGDDDSWIFMSLDETPEEKEEAKRILKMVDQIEEDQENEDTEMILRLIKIRRSLWT